MSDQPISLENDQPETPKPQSPGLVDQLVGVFTNPIDLFHRLNKAPSWGWAMGVRVAGALIVTVVWSLKVDVDEMLRPILERNSQIASSQVDTIIEMQKKFLLPIGMLGALFGTAAVIALMALLYWLVGRVLSESETPSYPQALSAAVVPSLVKLPYLLLLTVICIVRPIGGLTPDKIAPTSLGYFFQVENLRLQAFLYNLDLFYLAEAVVAYLALRYLVRLKTMGSLLCMLLPVVIVIGVRVLGAK
jgi:hypothetical protein